MIQYVKYLSPGSILQNASLYHHGASGPVGEWSAWMVYSCSRGVETTQTIHLKYQISEEYNILCVVLQSGVRFDPETANIVPK